MTLTSPQYTDHRAPAPQPTRAMVRARRWPQQAAAEPTRPDIAWDLIARADAADRRWELPPATTVSGRTCSPYELLVSANTQVLRRIVGVYRWPGLSLVGQTGAEAALRLALHATDADHDHGFVRTLLRLITDAAEHGEATWAQWAHLQDRVSVLDGRPQQYGTQYRLDAPLLEPELHPVIAPEQLTERRLAVGLPALTAPAPPPALPHPET
ncbi:DUF6624 domain-containing protein [Streptomyces sp. NPDC058268]|uniref:DUF6624 domain-containing protein n=1 Tax=Streptomyces sp. NPDC058268 TaxID=3346413 RepID=UPI0036E3A13F